MISAVPYGTLSVASSVAITARAAATNPVPQLAACRQPRSRERDLGERKLLPFTSCRVLCTCHLISRKKVGKWSENFRKSLGCNAARNIKNRGKNRGGQNPLRVPGLAAL